MTTADAPSPEKAEATATTVDHYVDHLSSVSTTNAVTTTEDIYNDRGVLLAKKGINIDKSVSARLIKHRLTKPLEQQVQIRQTITRHSLLDAFNSLLNKYSDLREIYRGAKVEQDFDLFIQTSDIHQVLAQKLTVMQLQMASEFEKGLFSALLVYLIMRQFKADRGTLIAAFTAALVHDLGMLHIDPVVTQKSGALTPQEWRAIQSHTVIGSVVLNGIPGLDPRISRAVLEHHERCDGTGYPSGKSETHLERVGQTVAIADAMHAIRVNQFEKAGRNLRDMTAVLQMNIGLYQREVLDAVTLLLRTSGLQPTAVNPHNDLPTLINHLKPRWEALYKIAVFLDTMTELTEKIQFSGSTNSLMKILKRLQTVVTQSGLLQKELGGWMNQTALLTDEHALSALLEIDLMLNELAWQLRSAHKALQQELDRPEMVKLPQTAILRRMADEMREALTLH